MAADHQLGQLLAAGGGRAPVRHHLAAAHDADIVGGGHDLAQLVRDQDHRAALCLQVAQDPEEMVGLLGREHARGLVQDQDVGAAEEGLQDLDPLLHAHRKVGDTGVERHFQPVLALDLLDLAPGTLDAGAQGKAALGAEEQVLQDGERLHQHEMLVDHADPGPDRVLRTADRPLLAVDQDLPAIGLIIAVEDVHQRRLAGTVLAHDPVDGAGGDAEVDVAVGLDGAEALADATQLDRRRLRARRRCGSDRHRHYFWVE